jgi:hypothetical protein
MKVKLLGINLLVNKKIAIVGNSNSIMSKDLSNEIDSFDSIIRFNFSNVKNRYTGKKTTIRWIRCPINMKSVQQHNKNIITEEGYKNYIRELLRNQRVLCSNHVRRKLELIDCKCRYYPISSDFNNWDILNDYLKSIGISIKFNNIEGCWIRTGLLAILTCIRSGCKPYIYGFDRNVKKYIKHYDSNYVYNIKNISYHQNNISDHQNNHHRHHSNRLRL